LLPLPPFPRADIDGSIITGCGYQLITGSLGDLEDRDFDHRSFPKNLPQTNIANRHLKHCQLFSIGNLEQYSLSAISALAERAVAALVPR